MSRIMGEIHDRVASAGHSVEYFDADSVSKFARGRFSPLWYPRLITRHVRQAALAGKPFDIVNVHEPSGASLARLKAGRRPILVATSHGVEQRSWENLLAQPNYGLPRLSRKTRLIHPWLRLSPANFTLRQADHILCLNFEDRDFLVDRFRIPPARITRIYPAASADYAATASQRDYSGATRWLFAGTWIVRKGIREVIAAFRILAAEHPQLELTILGGGVPAATVLSSFPAELHSRVRIVQTANDQAAAAEFARAHFYTLPSYFEGTPLTLIEAMASGLPVVTTAVCGMKDVIRHEENGLLIPPYQADALMGAVRRILADSSLRERLGGAAHTDATTQYTWDQVAQPVIQLYEQLGSSRIVPFTR